MVRFVHTADWQMGMKAGHVAEVADQVRAARLETAARIVAVARERGVQFLLIVGDLFEDSHISDLLMHQVLRILGQAAPIPVYILPGNHDHLGAGSVYARRAFLNLPANIHVIREPAPILIPGIRAVLLPYPIRQKHSEEDPTTLLPPFEGEGIIRIGVAHGSLRIESKYQPDDFPIALDAVTRRRLDYLALGHWHSFYQHDARTVYPGTPEPTGFDEPGSGTVSVVRIEGPGATPVVEQVRVCGLNWMQREETLTEPVEVGLQDLKKRIEEHAQPDQTLLRLHVRGQATVEAEAALEDLEAWATARVLYLDLDRTGVAPDISRGRLRDLTAAHPLLAGMIADLAALELMADSPRSIQPGHPREQDQIQRVQAEPLELDELRKVLAATATNADTIREAIKLLGGFASEVWL